MAWAGNLPDNLMDADKTGMGIAETGGSNYLRCDPE